MPRFRLDGVSRAEGERVILDGASLEPRPGEVTMLQGPSGAGKTTLLRLLGLLDAPGAGRVLVDGQDAWEMGPEARAALRLHALGHAFQAHAMMPRLSLLENVLLPMRLAGRPDAARAEALLRGMGLHAQRHQRPHEVSLGERQRACLARALAMDPPVLLADEPTASLDEANAGLVAHVLLERALAGGTVVVASHDPRLWRALPGSRVFRLEAGRLEAA